MTVLRDMLAPFRWILDVVGRGLQVSANLVLLPGVAMLALVRWSLFRLQGVSVEFGPWWSPESRGIPADQEPTVAEAYGYLLGILVLTGMGLLLLLPDLIRDSVLGIPIFNATWQNDGILESAILQGLRDPWRGAILWFGLSFLVVSPLGAEEMGRVIAALRTGRVISRVVATVLVPLHVALRLVEPFDVIGRVAIGAAWAVGWLWLVSLSV